MFLEEDHVREHMSKSQIMLKDISKEATRSNKYEQPIIFIIMEELRTVSKLQ